MPLDVKPLSPARRIAMVALMFGLLAGSLGFANYLVWRQANPWTGGVVFPLPPGAKPPLVVNTDLRRLTGLPEFCAVRSAQGPRRYALFSIVDIAKGRVPPPEYMTLLFETFTGGPLEEPLHLVDAKLGGHPGLEAEQVYGAELFGEPDAALEAEPRPSAFAIMRLAVVDGQVVAVGFSGAGRLSEADRESFNDYCALIQTGAH